MNLGGGILTNFSDKEKRREHDFYPTPPECTIALMDFIKLPVGKIWECACGEGAISKVLLDYGHDVFSSDIKDYGFGISEINFLTTKANQKFDAIITNPPFNLSVHFIQKALKEAPVVAMLLKSQYWHSKSRYSLFMKHNPAFILPLTWRPNFAEEKGDTPTMEVYWTVWIEGNYSCQYIPLLKPKNKNQITLFV